MSGILVVPIYGAADEVLELPKDQLPDDPNEIMQILANELTPLKLWLELAVSYYQQQRIDQFTVVMETSTGDEGPFYQDYYKDDKDGRIALLNCLAAFNTTVAARSKNKLIKDQHLARAVELYQQADKIDPNMALTYVGKGLVHMAKMSLPKTKNKMKTADEWNEHLSQAAVNFENACQCDAGCIPAILGKAAVQFNRRQYADALKSYKRVLQLNPAAPPEVRLGLANCLAQLKYTEKAAQAFRRVLELAPDNVEALSGLAILEMNSEPDEKLSDEEKRAFMEKQIETALKMLERAYNSTHNQGDQNAVVLNHLANHFVIKGDLEKAFRLATKAFNNTEVRKMRAESTYHIARTHHIKSEYESAHKYYEYATHYAPDYLLPQFGLAQTNVHLNKLSEAMACLDKLLRAFPNSYEVRKLMGCVAHRNGDTSKAILHLTFIVENYPEDRIDEEVWVELGTLYELRDPHRALSMYSKARDALKRRNAKVPGELLNNIAALYHKRGFDAQAKIFYLKALKQMGVKPPSEEGELVDTDVPEKQAAYRGSAISIMYNLARLHEQMHDMTYAERLYRSILKERPNYTDAYMRLGAMAEARGNNRAASIWYKEVITVSPHNADAYTALAKLHVGEKNLAAAQKKLEKILHKNDKDAYASIMLGNIYLNNARYEKHKDKDRDSEAKDKVLSLLALLVQKYKY